MPSQNQEHSSALTNHSAPPHNRPLGKLTPRTHPSLRFLCACCTMTLCTLTQLVLINTLTFWLAVYNTLVGGGRESRWVPRREYFYGGSCRDSLPRLWSRNRCGRGRSRGGRNFELPRVWIRIISYPDASGP